MSESTPTQPARSGGVHLPILFGLVIALVAANGYLFYSVDNLKTEMSKMQVSILAEIAKVRETSDMTTSASRQNLETLREELATARQQAAAAAGNARTAALKHAEQLAQRLQAEQQRQQELVNTELTQVKEAASTTNTKIADVSTEVGSVKTEVASTKSELDRTIAELKSVRGDLGVQSGLIATNGQELSALKALGERNYFEFNLAKTEAPQKVGNVMVRLKKADPKRNRYTIELVADDRKVEKKDKTVNEPVQFYVSGARQPYEIVVNQVKKNQIVGYMASPKVMNARG